MKKYPLLNKGDSVEVIAPASRCSDQHLTELKALLTSWDLNCIVSPAIFGDDLLCANTDEMRLHLLKNALFNPDTKAVICARGGYGCMRLMPDISQWTPPKTPKLFVGMSDITTLNSYLQQAWQWPVIHGALAIDKFSAESIAALKALLFGETEQIKFLAHPLNAAAKENRSIRAPVTGGNLCLVQASLSTTWQLDGRNKIILLEEINERGYRIDRMLEQLQQAGIFKHAAAILFGDFLEGKEPDGTSLVQPVLERFASASSIPVIQVSGIGHGYTNFPVPLGIPADLHLGKNAKLMISFERCSQSPEMSSSTDRQQS
ncbi:MAG TPA: LD-carboxypeptidase [Gammaproteobacteria bacterium]|nr:LD-carboxypeptidase [Gammaproteobacteria bacterium]